MVGKREITAKLGLDGTQAQSALASFKKQATSSFTEMNSAIGIASKAWSVLSGAISAAAGFMEDAVKASTIQEGAERRLAEALRLRGEFTQESFESQKRFAAAVQDSTTIGDEAVIGLQSQLIALGVHKDQLELATKAAIGLSEITGKDLLSGARAISQELRNGTSKEVKRLGLEGHSTAETMSNLAAGFQLAKDKAETFAGKQQQMSNLWVDLNEKLGDAITKNKDVLAVMDDLKGALRDVGEAALDKAVPAIAALARNTHEAAIEASELRKDMTWIYSQMFDDQKFRDSSKREMESITSFLSDVRSQYDQTIGVVRNLREALTPPTLGPELPAGFYPREPEKAPTMKPAKTAAEEAAEKRASEERKKAREQAAKDAAEDSSIRASIDEDRWAAAKADNEAQMSLLRQFEDQKAEFKTARRKEELDMETQANEMRFQKELESYDARQKAQESFYSVGLGALANSISTVTQALAEGNADAGDIAKTLTGGVIAAVGNLLIQLGTAAFLAGGIGTVVPFLAPMTGGPLGIAAGLAAIAAGSVMVGLGGALSHSGGSHASASARAYGGGAGYRGAGSGHGGFDSGTRGFALGFGTGGGSIVNNTILQVSGFVVGSERGLAREMSRVLRQGDTLAVGAR